ncbi:MAG: hypothetical protein KA155_08055 [Alphaproteobacteria bacterium]|nr:hypothetical protein [Alphaproteobacteria bacterium]
MIGALCLLISGVSFSKKSFAEMSEKSREELWVIKTQDGVRNHLKDPSSAKFRNSVFHRWQGTPVVCGEVNSKNSFGGFGGFQRFIASGDAIVFLEEEVSDFDNAWGMMCK